KSPELGGLVLRSTPCRKGGLPSLTIAVASFTPALTLSNLAKGFVEILNNLSGNPIPAPECLQPRTRKTSSWRRELLKTDPSPDQRLSPSGIQNNVLRPSLDAHHRYREVATLRTNELVHLGTGFLFTILLESEQSWCSLRFAHSFAWIRLSLHHIGILTMDELRGRVGLITGASRGIGAAIAIALAKVGMDVAVNYHSRAEDAERVVAGIRTLGRRVITIRADVASTTAIKEMVTRTHKELGPISILVNNAAVGRQRKLEEITEADWDEAITTNLKSTFIATQAVLPGMRAQRWGRIINLSSVAAQTGGVVGPHYAASKAGMLGLTHSYAGLLAKEGITVNAIAPALIETEMVTSNPRANPGLIPVGRFGVVEEVADVAVMLCRNGYITGQTINVNGGWYFS